MRDDLLNDLNELLDTERNALIAGRLEDVSQLYDSKSDLLESLSAAERLDDAALSIVRNKLSRNQDLLQSAMDGIQSVARRLATVRRVRQSLETYDSRGRKTSIDVRIDSQLEKRT